jgi:hypothetical protein
MMSLGPSLIRTAVPLLVTLLGPYAARWLGWDAGQLEQFLGVVLGAVYYLAVRLAERRWPAAGVLLGVPRAPVYAARHAQDGDAA